MRKWVVCFCVMALLCCMAVGAMAAGVTLRTFTPFADIDDSAQSYMDMITAWESETGNVVEDYSGLPDEIWMSRMLEMVRAGEADVVVLPLNSGLTYEELATVEEIIEAVPDLGVRRFEALTEADGSVLLSPLRVSWEALYINKDVFDKYGLAVPGTYEELLAVCGTLAGQGVTPIANALDDWAEIVLDCAALASAAPEAFGSQASLDGAQQMLSELHAAGAFGSEAFGGSDMDAMQAFADGKAAMRIDGDMLAQMLPYERRDSVIVIPMPQRTGQSHSVLAGLPGFGVAITRACWEDDVRREAAVTLVRSMLTGGDIYRNLVVGVDGALGESIANMLQSAADCAGILFEEMDGDFDSWAAGVMDALK